MQKKILTNNSISYNIIYIYTVPKLTNFAGYCKIGKTSIEAVQDWKSIDQQDIDERAKKRISEINSTGGLDCILEYATIAIRTKGGIESQFSDSNFHSVLKQNGVHKETPSNIETPEIIENICKSTGREWFKIPANKAIEYIKQFKDGKINFEKDSFEKITLREPQLEASNDITKAWHKIRNSKAIIGEKKPNKFLLNALMRFGKCITTYDFIIKNNIQKVLILTHRPVVKNSWKEDYDQFLNNKSDLDRKNKNYHYLTKNDLSRDDSFDQYLDKNLIYFASIQDLRGIEWKKDVNNNYELDDNENRIPEITEIGKIEFKKSNQEIFETEWDLVVVDEAHEGNLTSLAKEMHSYIKKKFSLFLSGTPFNIVNEETFNDEFGENIFVFDQKREYDLKHSWSENNGTDHNPYDDIPDLNILGLEISNDSKQKVAFETGFINNYFDFNLFFQLDENNHFVNHDAIIKWLDNMSSKSADDFEVMPFHSKNRSQTKHSLWYLPVDIKKAEALQLLLENHPIFKYYKIFNACGKNYNENTFNDILKTTNDETKCSVTLTIGRLIQGVTVPGWTAILLLNNVTSPMNYFQSIYRVKSPSPKSWITRKTSAQVYDFNPDRMLDLIHKMIESKMTTQSNEEYQQICHEVANYYNILIFKDNDLIKVNDKILKDVINNITVNRVVNNGFKSKELLDFSKMNKHFVGWDADRIKKELEFVSNLEGKIAKNKTGKDNNKITSNDFDEKIFKANEEDENKLTAAEADRIVSDKKSLDLLKAKIKNFILTITTRLPFMLIGRYNKLDSLNEDYLHESTIEKFCNLFDDDDWSEIMQSLEKKEFKSSFNDYINMDIFVGSCNLYKMKIKEIIDVPNPFERQKMWIELFKAIHNPDSETVLTPWNVVEIQHEVMDLNWFEIYKENKTFIDINSKSAFYPLFAACKLYEQQLKHNIKDWRNIIYHRIFAICRTNLTKDVAKIILDFKENDKNIIVYDIIKNHDLSNTKKSVKWKELIEEIMSKFAPKLKFDYCISNPPYQLPVVSNKVTNNKAAANNIFDKFVLIGKEIANSSCMIFPAKWMTGGKGLQKFRQGILSSSNVQHLIDCEDYWNLFPTISLHCGLTILIMDNKYHESTKISYLNNFKISEGSERKLNEYDVLVIDQNKYDILKAIERKMNIKNADWSKITTMNEIISSRKPFGISSNFFCNSDESISLAIKEDAFHSIKIYYITINKEYKNLNSNGNRTYAYIKPGDIKKNVEWISNWKVCIPIARGGDRNDKSILSKTIICEPNSICSESYRICKFFKTEKEARMFSYFMESKILRFLVSIRKLTQNAPRDVYKFVPYVDVVSQLTNWQSQSSDSLKRQFLDKEIMEYFGLTKKQQNYILSNVNEISNDFNFDLENIEDSDED